MRIKLTFLILVAISPGIGAQVLKGTIRDLHGDPIPYSTVFIKELSQGTTANTMGDYEIRLPDGKYTVIFESLGFEPDIKIISVSKNTITQNIILQEQVYEIPEVRITASGEDPAYGIMRKVIGIAPYYLNMIESYKAEVYLKGNLLLKRIPRIIQRQMKVEARNNQGKTVSSNVMKEGETYMMESFNEIEFNAPDRYKQHVISSQSTFPEEGNEISPMDFIRASFYEPVLNNMFISPLSPQAFFHYKFRYLGVSAQGNYYIDKIEVTPKRKSQQLFQGTIYVIEDLWCLHSVDLNNDNIAGNIRIQQLFIPVEENLWMPVSDKFDVNISIIGVKGEAGYGSSIKYKDVIINRKLKKPEGLQETGKPSSIFNTADTIKNKTSEQIERILSKKELSNRDMAKLSNLMNRQSKNALPDSIKNNLEVKERTTFVIEKDANRKDSTYWAGIRPIPLSPGERKSLRSNDSLKATLVIKTTGNDSLKKAVAGKKDALRTPGWITFGHMWSDTTGLSFSYGGLLNLKNLSFNTVDGLVYGMDFRLNKTFNKKFMIGLYPFVQYAFSRDVLMWRLNGQFGPVNNNRNQFYFVSGSISRDLNSYGGGIFPLVNSITTLFLEENYLKLYSAGYLTIGYRREIAHGLRLNLEAGYENRKKLTNTTDFTFFKTSKGYTANDPVNPYLDSPADQYYAVSDHKHGDFTVTLRYTPMEHFIRKGEVKIPRGSDWPTFSLSWKHGVNYFESLSPSLKQFDFIRLEITQNKSIGAFSEFRWIYRAGTFLNDKGFSFIDFVHFNCQYFPVMIKSYEDAFYLPRFYSMSTPEMFSELHFKYTTPYLLIKLIPGISKTLMRENLSFSSLLVKNNPAYTEVGYSISEILLMGELGVYAGFNNFRYNSAGVRLVLRLN